MTRKRLLLLIGLTALVLSVTGVLLRARSVAEATANASASDAALTAELGADAMQEVKPAAPVQRSSFAALNHRDILPRHRALLDETMRSLPDGCRWALKNLYVRYDDSVSRALGGTETIVLNGNVGDDELRALFIHEFAHITDLGCFTGTQEAGASGYRDGSTVIYNDDPSIEFYGISWAEERVQLRGVRSEDFVSGYASWDAFEDFAETYAYYILQRDAFAARALENDALQRKFLWMETYVGTSDVADGLSRWTGTIPWDVTKLGYVWRGPRDLAAR